MASPVNVGDVILLARTAYNLCKAFTSGRKSAPAEFVEVQGLLYTLSSALDLVGQQQPKLSLRRNVTSDGTDACSGLGNAPSHLLHGGNDAVMSQCLANCNVTLKHLQVLVTKYMDLDPTNAEASSKKWKDDVKRSWRKVTWTREGAGLDKLKISLTAHINAINLALAAQQKSKGEVTLNRVEDLGGKLDEIYEWFAINLRDRQPTSTTVRQSSGNSRVPQQLRSVFAVWQEATHGTTGRALICPQASFIAGWAESFNHLSEHRRIFECLCSDSGNNSERSRMATKGHGSKLNYFLLPISLLTSIASRDFGQEWQLFTGSPTSAHPVTLRISGAIPSVADFWSQVAINRAKQASRSIADNSSNAMIAVKSVDGSETVDTTPLFGKVASLTFDANGRRFKTPNIDTVQLLHYACILRSSIVEDGQNSKLMEPFRGLSDAHLMLHCADMSSSASCQSWTIKIALDTRFRLSSNLREVIFYNVICLASDHKERIRSDSQDGIECREVQMSFQDKSTAGEALHLIKLMQEELRISYLKGCRWEEQIMFSRQIGNTAIQEFWLRDARLEVVLNPRTVRYRLIISSGCKSLFVCTELPEDFLLRIDRGESLADLDLPMWFVEIGGNKTHVTKRSSIGQVSSIGLLEKSGRSMVTEHQVRQT